MSSVKQRKMFTIHSSVKKGKLQINMCIVIPFLFVLMNNYYLWNQEKNNINHSNYDSSVASQKKHLLSERKEQDENCICSVIADM